MTSDGGLLLAGWVRVWQGGRRGAAQALGGRGRSATDPQPPEPVQQRDRLLDHPAVHAQARTVLGGAPGDDRGNALLPGLAALLVVVIATVGEHLHRPPLGPAAAAADRRDGLDQRDELGDIMPVAAGQRGGQRNAAGVGDHVVLGPGPGPVDRAGAGLGPPFSARTRDPSAAARDQSITPATLSRASSTSCSLGHTPAWCPSRSRRPAGYPLDRIPAPAARTPTGCRCTARTRSRTARCGHPAAAGRDAGTSAPASGSGSISSHRLSSTCQGLRCATPASCQTRTHPARSKLHQTSFC